MHPQGNTMIGRRPRDRAPGFGAFLVHMVIILIICAFTIGFLSLFIHATLLNIPWPGLVSGYSIFLFLYHIKCDYQLEILNFLFLLLFKILVISEIPPNPQFLTGFANTVGWSREVSDRCAIGNQNVYTVHMYFSQEMVFFTEKQTCLSQKEYLWLNSQ